MRLIFLISFIFFVQLSFTVNSVANEDTIQILQLVKGKRIDRRHINALPSLLSHLKETSNIPVASEPIIIESFGDDLLTEHAMIYANFADRDDWVLSDLEKQRLKDYLKRGGFLYIDAGIAAEFLRKDNVDQYHSFAEWEVRVEIKEIFKELFPDIPFLPLERDHDIFNIFYQGLPDPANLPDAIRDFIVNEKWPQGSISIMGLAINNHLSVIATPIMAIGWGKDITGQWSNKITFRVREKAEHLDSQIGKIDISGKKYETRREDGLKDIIYTQQGSHMPTWVEEAEGHWRVFRFYEGKENSDYAHLFFTRLGVNIWIYALTH
ncbi:MAG: DUF4159 domain-containing protein [Candidatus Anammoxibacter sp.]